jgi:L-ascorbate metabolism protein UlaG (beta-lactamase superfamily)
MAKITWFGHSAVKIEFGDKIVLVDPWFNDNPMSPVKADDISQADIVYVTHDHFDHLGDAFAICKRTKAMFVATFELGNYAEENGVENVTGLSIGGSVEIKGIKLFVVQAFHTASRGAPTDIVIEGKEKVVYHAGDTALFGDMRLIRELHKPDLVLIPIGGHYTMMANEAAEAAKMLKPKAVIPIHYKTFPVLAQSPDEFIRKVKKKAPKTKVVVLNPGEGYQF